MWAQLKSDLDTARERDPAARSSWDVALNYPGVHALWAHRISSWLWHHDHRALARFLAAAVRVLTAVDIHPAASIGPKFFIDHATGVVIGETTEIGEGVTLYQGVTLGGTSLEPVKRHPTIGDRVTIGAGAKVLGPIEIGEGSRIGANAVVVKDVPANSVVVGIPGQVIARSRPRSTTSELDLDDTALPDLIGASLQSLLKRVDQLETALNGSISASTARPSPTGVWAGEDFSI